MTTEALRLSELARAMRGSTLKRFALVPAGLENWQPTEQALSFADIALHLVDADEWLVAKLVNPQLTGIKAVAGTAVVPDRAAYLAILERLRATGDRRCEIISGLTNAALDAMVFDDRFGGQVSVWWVIVRGNLEHEAQHRGQAASYLRVIGASCA